MAITNVLVSVESNKLSNISNPPHSTNLHISGCEPNLVQLQITQAASFLTSSESMATIVNSFFIKSGLLKIKEMFAGFSAVTFESAQQASFRKVFFSCESREKKRSIPP